MVPVLPRLYLSGADLGPADGSEKPAVTALLQVDSEPPGAAALAAFESTLFVQALDRPQSDVLSRLDDHAGVSRSVAIVTAYLMKTNHLTFQEAYAFVQAIKPDAKMNEGFEWQLQLYEKMGCKVDVSSIIYKQYRLKNITENCPETEGLPGHVFAIDPNTIHQIPNHDIFYRCRKCSPTQLTGLLWGKKGGGRSIRRLLFRSSSILPHDEGKGPAAFAHKKVSEPGPLGHAGQSNCTSYFIEPVQWMEAALLGVLEGQLLCPKCTSKLGSFHWHGEQCSCGHWVTPAFQIHKNRVDEVKRLPIGEPKNVRK
ncbi:dual specificity protein phosphatase 12 isoform X3 [Pantherophis guttatus]|uniref:protein-tyrosine-phosphatase n=1 Tax=Pantherophis guttatus TaxID=94885 RepID=A0ABM3ZD57_PANGU|nr:dual specificity protein phosphatase 12 isoform X3 [Pantherophis guttatus]